MSEAKALTIRQPWASLIACGAKTIVTRGWNTKYRGPLLIHAGASIDAVTRRDVLGWAPRGLPRSQFGGSAQVQNAMYRCGLYPEGNDDPDTLPLGAVVAVATLADVVPIVAERDLTTVPGRGPLLAVAGEHAGPQAACVTGLTWRNTVSPSRYIDKDWTERIRPEIPLGVFTPGRYAWLLTDVHHIEPVPAKGRQGLWAPDDDLAAAVV